MLLKVLAFVFLALGGFVVYGSDIINNKLKIEEKVSLKNEDMKYESDQIKGLKNQKANILIKSVGLIIVVAGVLIVIFEF